MTWQELLIVTGTQTRGLRQAVEDARAEVAGRRAELDAVYALRAGAPRQAIEEAIADAERQLDPFDAVLADFDGTETALLDGIAPDDEPESLKPLVDLYVTHGEALAEIADAYDRVLAAYAGALEQANASVWLACADPFLWAGPRGDRPPARQSRKLARSSARKIFQGRIGSPPRTGWSSTPSRRTPTAAHTIPSEKDCCRHSSCAAKSGLTAAQPPPGTNSAPPTSPRTTHTSQRVPISESPCHTS